jgi:hypothetical protein
MGAEFASARNEVIGRYSADAMWGSAKRSGNGTPGDNYVAVGGTNGVFNFPADGTHSGVYRGQPLQQVKPDLQRARRHFQPLIQRK